MSDWVDNWSLRGVDEIPKGLKNSDLVERERFNGSNIVSRADEAFWPNTIRWRKIEKEGNEMTTTNNLIHRFKSGTIVDRNKFNSLSNDKLAKTAAELYKEGAPPPIFVQSVTEFFSKNNLMKQVADNGEHLSILLEKWGIDLTPEQLETLDKFAELKKFIVDKVNSLKSAYPFADVPEGFSIEDSFKVTKTSIRRKSGNYSVTVSNLKKVFEKAVSAWAKEQTPQTIYDMNIGGSWRNVNFSLTGLNIGCQSVARYELEQMGLHLGWEFPE